jgi:hypothetical protein
MDQAARAPAHLWIVGVLSLLWNAFGGYDYVMSVTKNAEYLAMFTDDQRAFFDSFPAWTTAFWALGVWGSVAGSLLLLARSRYALIAFALSLLGLVVSSFWQYFLSGADLSKVITGPTTYMIILVWAGLIAQLLYAQSMRAKGVLR